MKVIGIKLRRSKITPLPHRGIVSAKTKNPHPNPLPKGEGVILLCLSRDYAHRGEEISLHMFINTQSNLIFLCISIF